MCLEPERSSQEIDGTVCLCGFCYRNGSGQILQEVFMVFVFGATDSPR